MQTYKKGYKYSNGVPMSDKFHDVLEKYCEYAKSQGCQKSKKEMYAMFESLIMKTAGLNPKRDYYK